MPDSRYLLQSSSVDGYQLEDGSGVYILEPGCYSSVVLGDRPVAYWRHGDASGFPQDSAGTNNATVATSLTYNVPGALSGDSNTAIDFGGVGHYEVPNATPLLVGDNFSIEFWFKRSTFGVGNADFIFSKGAIGGTSPKVFIGGSDFLTLFNTAVGNVAFCDTSVNDGNLHYAVVVKNGATVHWYLEGSLVADDIVNATAFTNSTDVVVIGAETTSTNFFHGMIDEVALYNYVLTATQVSTHYAAASINCNTFLPYFQPMLPLLPQ